MTRKKKLSMNDMMSKPTRVTITLQSVNEFLAQSRNHIQF